MEGKVVLEARLRSSSNGFTAPDQRQTGMLVSDLSRTLEPTGKLHAIEKLHFQHLPQEGRMPKVGLGQSPSLEEYPGGLVHQFPQQLLHNGVTGLGPGVNQMAFGGSGLDPCAALTLSPECHSLTEEFSYTCDNPHDISGYCLLLPLNRGSHQASKGLTDLPEVQQLWVVEQGWTHLQAAGLFIMCAFMCVCACMYLSMRVCISVHPHVYT